MDTLDYNKNQQSGEYNFIFFTFKPRILTDGRLSEHSVFFCKTGSDQINNGREPICGFVPILFAKFIILGLKSRSIAFHSGDDAFGF
ncbi:hypothetical protein ABIE26_004266 [Pedobacter africanus]|uniref:Uncharacterized protein n=1 Tax=Pedobacter africanus TaxID=151894 RepID=A0ACC6L236_9SPHI|nr:hypothetical protein [Pedobacter africanus]